MRGLTTGAMSPWSLRRARSRSCWPERSTPTLSPTSAGSFVQNHAAATIGHVHSHPALVISPRTDGCGSNPALVEFDHGGIDISIYSTSYGTQTLLSVADSLVPLPAPGVVTGIAAPCAGPPAAGLRSVTVFAIQNEPSQRKSPDTRAVTIGTGLRSLRDVTRSARRDRRTSLRRWCWCAPGRRAPSTSPTTALSRGSH